MKDVCKIKSVVIEGKNSVTGSDRGTQFYFANQEALEVAEFNIGAKFKSITTENDELILELVDDPNEGNGTVSKKSGSKRIIDTRRLPESWAKGMKLKVTATKKKLIISLHCTEKEVKEREENLRERFINNENIKIGEIFAGSKMKKMLKENGLVNLANDCSCKLAIEINQSEIQRSMSHYCNFWMEKGSVACKDIHNVDFSTIELEQLDGLIADLTMLNNIGQTKSKEISEEDEKLSTYFLAFFEVLRRTNPAFVIAEIYSNDVKKVTRSPILSILEGVFDSLNYNCKIEIEEGDLSKAKVVALSKNITLDELQSYQMKYLEQKEACNDHNYIQPSNYVKERIIEREERVKHKLLNNMYIENGSCFSGGGIADAASHEGFSKSKINSYCKYGFEIEEKYSASNLRNNRAIWNKNSHFKIGDISQINLYDDFDYKTEGNISGVPCVGHSVAGISKNGLKFPEEHKLAGKLFISYLTVIKAANCAYTTLENVKGFMKSFSMDVIRPLMSFFGYNISEKLMTGSDFRAIEDRERFVMVCISKNIYQNNILEEIQPVRDQHQRLGDCLNQIKHSDPSWYWYDYLDSKAIADKAKGSDFSQQFVNEKSVKCGVISKGYKKARSTEPFILWGLRDQFKEFFLNSKNKMNLEKVCSEVFSIADIPEMVIHFSETSAKRYNLRNKLKGDAKVKSKLAALVQDLLLKNALNEISEIIKNDNDLYNELTETLHAMSKATRLFYVDEHANCKKVPVNLVSDLSETTGHEILGNGVIFTLFVEVAKKIGETIKAFALGVYKDLTPNTISVMTEMPNIKEESTFEQLEFQLIA